MSVFLQALQQALWAGKAPAAPAAVPLAAYPSSFRYGSLGLEGGPSLQRSLAASPGNSIVLSREWGRMGHPW